MQRYVDEKRKRTSEAFEHQAVVGTVSRGGVPASYRKDKSFQQLRRYAHPLSGRSRSCKTTSDHGFCFLELIAICWSGVDDSEVENPGYCIARLRFSMLRRCLAFRPDTIPAVNISGSLNFFDAIITNYTTVTVTGLIFWRDSKNYITVLVWLPSVVLLFSVVIVYIMSFPFQQLDLPTLLRKRSSWRLAKNVLWNGSPLVRLR